MAEVSESLRRRYGPLTGWQWGLVAVAAATTVVLLRRYRSAQAAAAGAGDDAGGAPVLVPYRGEMPFDSAVPGPGVLQPIHDGGGGGSEAPAEPEPSRESWALDCSRKIDVLQRQGKVNFRGGRKTRAQIFAVLLNYARTREIPAAQTWQHAAVNVALGQCGAPPV